MRRVPSAVLALAVVALLPAWVAGQAPAARADSLPFHRGQWAVRTAAGFEWTSLGALRFRSARSAWLLDAHALVRRSSESHSFGDVLGYRIERRVAQLDARVGRRAYRGGAGRAVSFYSVGVVAGGSHERRSASTTVLGVNGGLFADVGGTYLLTRHLGIGAYGVAEATYGITRERPTGNRGHTVRTGLSGLRLELTLFL